MVVGIIPDRKLIARRGRKVIVDLPILDYIDDILFNHYVSPLAPYPRIRIKVVKTHEYITNAIAGILSHMEYAVDIVTQPTSYAFDVLFVPSGYILEDEVKERTKIVEY